MELEFDESTRARIRRIDALVERFSKADQENPALQVKKLLAEARSQPNGNISTCEYLAAADQMLLRMTTTKSYVKNRKLAS